MREKRIFKICAKPNPECTASAASRRTTKQATGSHHPKPESASWGHKTSNKTRETHRRTTESDTLLERCTGARNMRLVEFADQLHTQEMVLKWVFEKGLVPRTIKRPYCDVLLTPKVTSQSEFGRFRCQRNHGDRDPFNQSAATNTSFEGCHMPAKQAIVIVYCFGLRQQLARRSVKTEDMGDHVFVYLWRRDCRRNNLDPFH